eukprot:TRINITY_DN57589_c0_g1_i1.p1 TRINITY_DN57589_c0_g1~~TRINITY_DN57589_c0_g1_i1.p1  ORF type:complete len:931 (+),score=104.20 TRINITY_DN57589_c0_g1_i1:239-2794(+)
MQTTSVDTKDVSISVSPSKFSLQPIVEQTDDSPRRTFSDQSTQSGCFASELVHTETQTDAPGNTHEGEWDSPIDADTRLPLNVVRLMEHLQFVIIQQQQLLQKALSERQDTTQLQVPSPVPPMVNSPTTLLDNLVTAPTQTGEATEVEVPVANMNSNTNTSEIERQIAELDYLHRDLNKDFEASEWGSHLLSCIMARCAASPILQRAPTPTTPQRLATPPRASSLSSPPNPSASSSSSSAPALTRPSAGARTPPTKSRQPRRTPSPQLRGIQQRQAAAQQQRLARSHSRSPLPPPPPLPCSSAALRLISPPPAASLLRPGNRLQRSASSSPLPPAPSSSRRGHCVTRSVSSTSTGSNGRSAVSNFVTMPKLTRRGSITNNLNANLNGGRCPTGDMTSPNGSDRETATPSPMLHAVLIVDDINSSGTTHNLSNVHQQNDSARYIQNPSPMLQIEEELQSPHFATTDVHFTEHENEPADSQSEDLDLLVVDGELHVNDAYSGTTATATPTTITESGRSSPDNNSDIVVVVVEQPNQDQLNNSSLQLTQALPQQPTANTSLLSDENDSSVDDSMMQQDEDPEDVDSCSSPSSSSSTTTSSVGSDPPLPPATQQRNRALGQPATQLDTCQASGSAPASRASPESKPRGVKSNSTNKGRQPPTAEEFRTCSSPSSPTVPSTNSTNINTPPPMANVTQTPEQRSGMPRNLPLATASGTTYASLQERQFQLVMQLSKQHEETRREEERLHGSSAGLTFVDIAEHSDEDEDTADTETFQGADSQTGLDWQEIHERRVFTQTMEHSKTRVRINPNPVYHEIPACDATSPASASGEQPAPSAAAVQKFIMSAASTSNRFRF